MTSGPTSASCSCITGDGLKTIDVVRGSFEVTEIAPRIEEFDDAFAGAAV